MSLYDIFFPVWSNALFNWQSVSYRAKLGSCGTTDARDVDFFFFLNN